MAGMVMPPKVRLVSPPANELGVGVPVHVVVTAPAFAIMFVRLSPNEALVSWNGFGFASVRVTVEVPFGAIEAGLNAFAIDAAPVTVRFAVLLGLPMVGV